MGKEIILGFLLSFLIFLPIQTRESSQIDYLNLILENFGVVYNVLSLKSEIPIIVGYLQLEVCVEFGESLAYQYICEKGYFYQKRAWQEFVFSNYNVGMFG